jgi:hypothetical protein
MPVSVALSYKEDIFLNSQRLKVHVCLQWVWNKERSSLDMGKFVAKFAARQARKIIF